MLYKSKTTFLKKKTKKIIIFKNCMMRFRQGKNVQNTIVKKKAKITIPKRYLMRILSNNTVSIAVDTDGQ